jgi:hypothetical protein
MKGREWNKSRCPKGNCYASVRGGEYCTDPHGPI